MRIDLPYGVWTEILPASDTAFATLEHHWPCKFVRAATQPTDPNLDGSTVTERDIVPASSTEPTYAMPKGGPSPNGATPWFVRQD